MGKTVVGYWSPLRGRVLPIHLLLAYTKEEYEQKNYDISWVKPDFNLMQTVMRRIEMEQKSEGDWFGEKHSLGMDFPSIPYLFIDGLKITDSHACWRYVARKHNLMGKTPKEQALTDTLDFMYVDLFQAFLGVVALPPKEEFEQKKQMYETMQLPKSLESLATYLGDKKFFLGGETPTMADFVLYDYFDLNHRFVPDVVAKFPTIVKFHERIEAIPQIAALKKDRPTVFWPAAPAFAHWGNDKK